MTILPAADADLEQYAVFIDIDNPGAARRFISAVTTTLERIVEMPSMGRRREFKNPILVGLRSWPIRGFNNYLIFYRPSDDGIDVIRVLHGARDVESILEAEESEE
ncbi:MAG: type II toxin-antitoxin system RelE/ParE family toxin [Phycisphaerae bacterium]|nr:type II toxin-antitoxin system RelE/ParE family toxin [Phycisphaerae bacterium]